jgi:hypothetical protein
MDSALWISWYDLPENDCDAYLCWLHESYIPGLLKRPGYLSASHFAAVPGSHYDIRKVSNTSDSSIPRGSRYILVVSAAHANVFGNPAPDALHAALSEADRKMLALRAGERMNVMVEATRIDGEALKTYQGGLSLAPCIQLGNFNYPWQHEDELLVWFSQWRMPAIAAKPGCVRVRKLASVAGWVKHAILYEYVSVEARDRDYLTLEDDNPQMKAWSDRVVARTTHAPGSATLATRLWPPAPC